jgi:probable HAF family extracellular repeat protein
MQYRKIIATLVILLFPNAYGWSQMYHLTDLGTLGGGESHPTAINNLGQVVGYSDAQTGGPRAFLYSNGVMINLGSPNGRPTYAYGINDNGSIVGKFLTPGGGSHPFLYSGGTYTDLWAPDAVGQGLASAVNNAGQIVGNYFIEYPQSTSSVDFAALQFPWGTAINDSGQVAGYTNPSFSAKRAFLYSGGTMTDLGLLPTGASFAYGMNAAGDLVGTSEADAQGHMHAFRYSNGVMTDLSLYGFGDAFTPAAFGINNNGQIVGGHFLYEKGGDVRSGLSDRQSADQRRRRRMEQYQRHRDQRLWLDRCRGARSAGPVRRQLHTCSFAHARARTIIVSHDHRCLLLLQTPSPQDRI